MARGHVNFHSVFFLMYGLTTLMTNLSFYNRISRNFDSAFVFGSKTRLFCVSTWMISTSPPTPLSTLNRNVNEPLNCQAQTKETTFNRSTGAQPSRHRGYRSRLSCTYLCAQLMLWCKCTFRAQNCRSNPASPAPCERLDVLSCIWLYS